MLDLDRTVWYKEYSIDYDGYGFWTVQYCGDDFVFATVKEAKVFIDGLDRCNDAWDALNDVERKEMHK